MRLWRSRSRSIPKPRTFRGIVRLLADPDPSRRCEAVSLLAKSADDQAFGSLMGALEDDAEVVRWNALHALGELGDRRAVPVLLAASREGTVDMRAQALSALGLLQDPSTVGAISEIVGDTVVGIVAVRVLGEIGDPAALPVVIPCLRSSWRDMRLCAARALGAIGEASAVGPLLECLDESMAGEAVDALERILCGAAGGVEAEHLSTLAELPPLRALAEAPNGDERVEDVDTSRLIELAREEHERRGQAGADV